MTLRKGMFFITKKRVHWSTKFAERSFSVIQQHSQKTKIQLRPFSSEGLYMKQCNAMEKNFQHTKTSTNFFFHYCSRNRVRRAASNAVCLSFFSSQHFRDNRKKCVKNVTTVRLDKAYYIFLMFATIYFSNIARKLTEVGVIQLRNYIEPLVSAYQYRCRNQYC